MKYTFHIVDVFSSTPFGGNQLAVLPDGTGLLFQARSPVLGNCASEVQIPLALAQKPYLYPGRK